MRRLSQVMVISIAAGLPAAALADFSTIQFAYSNPENGNIVALIWDQATPGQVRILVDGTDTETVPGIAGRNIAAVGDLTEGIHAFELLQGNTSLGRLSQEVVSIQPTRVIEVTCRQSDNPDTCEIIVTGTSDGPPVSRVDIFLNSVLVGSPIEEFVDELQKFRVEITVPVLTTGPHQVVARWTIDRDDPDSALIGSFVSIDSTLCATTCGLATGARYTPGVCNGSGGAPDLSSAVFGLNYLFAKGTAPPCIKACDANDDGDVNVVDMIHLLNFLFSGGPAPTAWTDRTGDAVPDPACTTAAAEENCAESHASCP